MKCLFVAAHDHYHGKSGGAIATRAMKASLEDVFGSEGVRLCCFDNWGQHLPRRVKQVISICRSLVSDLPSRSIFVLPANARRCVSAAVAEYRPDLIVVNSGDVWPILEAVPAEIATVLVAHNVEHLLMRGQIDLLAGAQSLLRPVLRRDVEKVRRHEDAVALRAGNILSISAEDTVYFKGLSGAMNVATFLPTFDYPAFERHPRAGARPLHVGFLAKMTWWPNREAATWFTERVLPRLDGSQVVAHFYGVGSEDFAGRLPNLVTHGFVEDLDDIWRNCDLMICPILSGSGINIKFVEALYNRMPVLATTRAARGLPAIEDGTIVYLDRAEEWVDFLSSARADELAARSVSTRISDMFRPESQRQHIADYVEAVLSRHRVVVDGE